MVKINKSGQQGGKTMVPRHWVHSSLLMWHKPHDPYVMGFYYPKGKQQNDAPTSK